MSLGSWGDLVFEVRAERIRTWHELRRQGEARWATHEVFAAKPVKEFLGPGLDSMTLMMHLTNSQRGVVFLDDFAGFQAASRGIVPADELRDLREQRDIGAVHQLVIGGELVFNATLKSMREEHRRHDYRGVLLSAVVELTFEEYA